MMEKLALDGGTPVRTRPLPSGKKWGWAELREILDVFESGAYCRLGATKCDAFEAEFAKAFGVKHAIGSTSGTASIHVAVGMVNPEPGEEIITGPITDFGTIVPILYQNAIPIFADSDPETFNIDPDDLEAKITSRTRAIMPVHLFGNPCDMGRIMEIARRHGLPVIEDCSQAHMAAYEGRLCGTIGTIGAFSLQASKHITTGEGGMTITDDEALAERGRLFADKGWLRWFGERSHLFLGPNYRMTELQGAVGLAQVRKLADVTARRNHNGDRLTELLGELPGIRPQRVLPGCKHTYWLYGLAVERGGPYTAEQFAQALTAEGIGAGAGYINKPIFLCAETLTRKITFGNSQHPFSHPNARPGIEYTEGTCPVTDELLPRMVTLGMSEFYADEDIQDMAAAMRKVAHGLAAKAPALA